MRFGFRRPRVEELPYCFRLIRDRFVYDSESQARLLRLWHELLMRRCANSAVIEDHECRRDDRFVAFGMSAFVTDGFLREAKRGESPYITRRALERWSAGSSPFLTLESIRQANSKGGLNCLVMHYGVTEHVADPGDTPFIWNRLMEAFIDQHRGYQLKEIIDEVYGEPDLRGLLALGTKLVTDYGTFFNKVSPPPLPDRRPYLVGATREDVLAQRFVTYSTPLFSYTPPRFHLTPGEQDLLEHALAGATDEGLASVLKVSLTAVKKRWTTIYERVVSVDPELLASGSDSSAPAGKRGVEKRRRLLVYLRDRPEELGPGVPPKTRPTGRGTRRAAPAGTSSRAPRAPAGAGRSGSKTDATAYRELKSSEG